MNPPLLSRLLRKLPFVGKLLIRYDRAMICLIDELGDTRKSDVEGMLCDESIWKRRRAEIGKTESFEGDHGRVAWRDFPYA